MSGKQLQYSRAAKPVKGTWWHRLSHVERGGERLSLEQLQDYVCSGQSGSKAISVENPYHQGDFIDDFLINPHTLAIISRHVGKVPLDEHVRVSRKKRHVEGLRPEERPLLSPLAKRIGEIPLEVYANLSPLSVLWKHVTLEPGVIVGPGAEVRPYANVKEGTIVADHSVIGRRDIIGPNNFYARGVLLGPRVITAAGVKVAEGSIIEADCRFGADVDVGMQFLSERGSRLDDDVFASHNVRIGRYVRVREGAMIGEGVILHNYSTVGAGAIVGAGAVVGEAGAVMPTGWVKANDFVPGRVQNRIYERY